MSKSKFSRTSGGTERTDIAGKVIVSVSLRERDEDGRYTNKKGNLTKSVTINGAQVSDVFSAIEKALF